MGRSPREIVRSAVGLAAIAPALGLLVLAAALVLDGGFSGLLAGIVVAGLALVLIGFAFVMTYAPVTIKKLLDRTEKARKERGETGGTNGHGTSEGLGEQPAEGPGREREEPDA